MEENNLKKKQPEQLQFEQGVIITDYTQSEEVLEEQSQTFKKSWASGYKASLNDAKIQQAAEHIAYLGSRRYRFLRTLDDGILALSNAAALGKQSLSSLVSPVQKAYRSVKNSIHETEWYKERQENEEQKTRERLEKRDREDPLLAFRESTGIDLEALAIKKARERDKTERETPLYGLDQTVTEEQREAIQRADNWLLSRAARKDAPLTFVRRVLESSLREKLFLYHQIEIGRMDFAGGSDTLVSQTSYTPDLSVIKKRLSGPPFHLWNKIRHKGARKIHWEKLDGAFELTRNEETRAEIVTWAGLDQLKNVDGLDISRVLEAVADCQRAIERRDNGAFFMKRVRNEEVQTAANKAFAIVEPLMAQVLKKYFSAAQKSVYKDSEEMSNLCKFTFAQTASLGGKVNQVPMLFKDALKDAVIQSKMNQTTATIKGMDIQKLMTGLNITAGAFTTMTGIMALMGTLQSLPKAIEAIKNGDLDWGSITTSSLGLGKGLLAGSFAASAGITTMIYAPAVGLQSAGLLSDSSKWVASIDQMKYGMKVAGATVSAASLAVDGVSGLIQGRNFIHHHKGSKQINELRKSNILTGIDADYAKGIVRLDRRNKAKKAVETAASAATNAVTLTTTLIAAPIGILVGAGVNITTQIATKITTKIMEHYSLKSTVDEFLQIKDTASIRALLPEGTEVTDKQLEKLREPLRERMAAELGYSSYKTLYRHVVQKYAGFLFQKLFFRMVDGKPVPYTRDNPPKKGDMELSAYTELVKGLGLRIKYPTDVLGTNRHPSPMMIAAKLMG